jgi:hypothetical protein
MNGATLTFVGVTLPPRAVKRASERAGSSSPAPPSFFSGESSGAVRSCSRSRSASVRSRSSVRGARSSSVVPVSVVPVAVGEAASVVWSSSSPPQPAAASATAASAAHANVLDRV